MTTLTEGAIARNSPAGLFLRYARARNRGFLLRQSMTLVGALVLALAASPALGVLCAALALCGDGVEYLVLQQAIRQPARGRRPAAWAALGQALAIAACVVLSWQITAVATAGYFALAFLSAAALNAGLALTHFPEGGRLRLGVYGITFLVTAGEMLLQTILHHDRDSLVGLMAGLIQAYATVLFIRAASRSQTKRIQFEHDLTEEKQALERSQLAFAATARQAERLALVAQKAHDNILFTTPDGRIEWVNEAFAASTGYGFDEAVGQFPGDLLNGPETAPQALSELIAAYQDRQPCRVEIQNRRKDGGVMWMEVSLTPVLNADGSPDVFIAIERDITRAKAHSAELAEARQAAEAANRAKSQFLATMSHEIRTPMNGVLGVADLLAETPLTPEQREYVATILDSGRALLDIINDVLDLSKLEAGRVDITAEPLRLTDVVRRSMDILLPVARKKGIALLCQIPDIDGLHVGDAGRLRQVLLNLIGNAVKFTERGGVTLTVARTGMAESDCFRIAIADTGIGIPADRCEQVFDSFSQADNSISRQFGGTGLGLTISRRLARQMGGDIEVQSEPGRGSVFTLVVPLVRAGQMPQAVAPLAKAAPQTALRVIVADDNRTNQMILRKMIERSVREVCEVANGAEAVAAYVAAPPDLILMDVSMPEMDGREATRRIRAHEAALGLPPCPIHALTAFVEASETAACLAAGMDGVLTKPLIRAELFALLTRVAASAFDLIPRDGIDRAAMGEPPWSTSPPASGTTNGRLTRSSGL